VLLFTVAFFYIAYCSVVNHHFHLLDVSTHVEVVVLVLLDSGHHMLEYLGSDLESIDLRTVLK
jgi:hypothetical protein